MLRSIQTVGDLAVWLYPGGLSMLQRSLVSFFALIAVLWISSFFSGVYAFIAIILLWQGVQQLTKKFLWRLPFFRVYSDFQTLNLSGR